MQEYVIAAGKAISAGGLVVYPTEGVYGIGCDPQNQTALERLLSLKQRDSRKGFILIASDISMLDNYLAPLSEDINSRIKDSWPGPVTWVMPAAENVSNILSGGRSTLAVRVSAHPYVRALCQHLGHALVSTSANQSGQPPLGTLIELQQTLGDRIDYIVPLPPGNLNRPTPIFDAINGVQLR